MKLLLTNDDGIDSPGLEALFDCASQLGEPIVLAPKQCWSGCSHRVTTDRPLRLIRHSDDRYVLDDGTPADCVRAAFHKLVPDFDWVLSGINLGGNLGADVYLSGTVAAVREAVLHGKPGIALSQYRKRGLPVDWRRAADWIAPILRELLAERWQPGVFWNINLPNLAPEAPDPDVVHCRLDPAPLPVSFREEDGLLHYNGDYHQRRRDPGTDVDVCFSGKIAVTRLSLHP